MALPGETEELTVTEDYTGLGSRLFAATLLHTAGIHVIMAVDAG
jgi:hypothetical protein